MTEAADPAASDKVLEIGPGLAKAAVLVNWPQRSMHEIIPAWPRARQTLGALGYRNIQSKPATGSRLARARPFDAIVVTAAPEEIPTALV